MVIRTLFLFAILTASVLALPGDHLKPGDKVPPIQEVDQTGESRQLSELAGSKGTVLVVFRSADW